MTGVSGGQFSRERPRNTQHDREDILHALRTRFGLRGMIFLHLESSQPPGQGMMLAHTYDSVLDDRLRKRCVPLLGKLVRHGRQCVSPMRLSQCDVAWEMMKRLELSPAAGLLFPLHGPQGCFAIALALHPDEAHLAEIMPTLHCHVVRLFEHFMQQATRHQAGIRQSEELSGRELECLYWCACGKSYWETAIILGISERTVNHHMTMARKKLGVQSNAQAVALASLAGLFLDYVCVADLADAGMA